MIAIREFCLRHPEVRDVYDIGQMLFFNWRWVWYVAAAMFLLNKTFIQVSLFPQFQESQKDEKTDRTRDFTY